MNRERKCYVCGAEPQDGCNAIGGEMAECPRPSPPAPRYPDDFPASEQTPPANSHGPEPVECDHTFKQAESGPTWTLLRCTKCDEERRDFYD